MKSLGYRLIYDCRESLYLTEHGENNFKIAPKNVDRKLITIISNKINHSYGLKSINMIANKYNGSVSIHRRQHFYFKCDFERKI